MRAFRLVLSPLVMAASVVPALADPASSFSPDALNVRLAAGEAAEVVARDAGCADVSDLEAYVLGERGEFVRLEAPFKAERAGVRPVLATPLAAEARGLRATTPFAAFTANQGFGATRRWDPFSDFDPFWNRSIFGSPFESVPLPPASIIRFDRAERPAASRPQSPFK